MSAPIPPRAEVVAEVESVLSALHQGEVFYGADGRSALVVVPEGRGTFYMVAVALPSLYTSTIYGVTVLAGIN